ncbi:MAG: Protein of unknown function (DUF3307) [Rhodobacteraceae bacterium HLUCCO18]|nr:MAG: Protein of unknown function (DUF3307) [Rhodobacteraceae bacterium HLUCCO18]
MAETIAALFLAHVLADYVLQTRWMVVTKRGAGFAAHIALVFATAVACLGQISVAVVLVTFVHLVIDAAKTILMPDRLWSYLADQGLHILSIVAVGALFPGAWQAGLWADAVPQATPEALAMLAGLVFAIRAGHFAIAVYIASPPVPGADGMTARHGALIGGLERAAVFAAVLGGVAALSLVILAAKAGLWWSRDGASAPGRERAVAATLASFAWALAAAYATRALIAML